MTYLKIFTDIIDIKTAKSSFQIKGCFAFLEEQTERRMDMDRFKELVRLASKIGDLFDQLLELRKIKPCPIGGENAFSLPAIMDYFTGTQIGVDFFEKFIKETRGRVRNNEGVVKDAKFRLLLDNIFPPFTAWAALIIF